MTPVNVYSQLSIPLAVHKINAPQGRGRLAVAPRWSSKGHSRTFGFQGSFNLLLDGRHFVAEQLQAEWVSLGIEVLRSLT